MQNCILGVHEEDHDATSLPIRKDEARAMHERLSAWHSPSTFYALGRTLRQGHSTRELIKNPRLKPLRDAWPLAEFSLRHKGVERVRLAGPKDQWPDGYVQVDRVIKNVEVTIALMPGRRMGDEYELDCDSIEFDPVEDWIARADAIPQALETAINNKIKMHYSDPTWLVVYLNLDEFGIRQHQTELVLAQMKERHARAFDRLFILWKDKLY
jgi:hypothetical protein